MAADHYKFNQEVTLFSAALADVVSLLVQINTSPGVGRAAIDLANAFFSVPVYKGHRKQSVLS